MIFSETFPTNNINFYRKVDVHYIVSFSGDLARAIQEPIIFVFFGLLILILVVGLKNALDLSSIRRYIKKRGEK
mgnify:CR=1 FL=1